jgi:putative cardiolipin synthase
MKALLMLISLLTIAASSFSYASEGQCRWLIDDKDALQARVDLIQQAKHEILAEYFSVFNDDQAVGGFALLLDAAKRGVKVKVIMDAVSMKVPRSVFNSLMENGKDAQGNQNIEIKLYNPITLNLFTATHRDHSKMLIVDGEKFITGDRNIGKKYFHLDPVRNFNSIDIITNGKKAVQDARNDFMSLYESGIVANGSYARNRPTQLRERHCSMASFKDYNRCQAHKKMLLRGYQLSTIRMQKTLEDILTDTPEDIVKSNTNTDWLKDATSCDVDFISHQPDKFVTKDTNDLTDALMALLGTTKRNLSILSPYLIPTKNMYILLENLLKNNIRVRVITNSLLSTDNLMAQAGYQSAKDRLIAMGIELYEYNGPNTTHAKAAVIDNSVVFIGTYNLDPRSAFLNREVGLFIKGSTDNRIAEELSARIETLRQNSLLVGKDGLPQNVEEQKKRIDDLGFWKKFTLKVLRYLAPLFKNQT